MVKVNARLLPIKAHYFFFMAAMGPILPFTIVFGKQLGISEIVMGTVTAVLPLLFLIAKPAFGYLADYFQRQRKLLFMSLIFIMCGAHVLLYFVPEAPIRLFSLRDLSCNDLRNCEITQRNHTAFEPETHYDCVGSTMPNTSEEVFLKPLLFSEITPEKCLIIPRVYINEVCMSTSNTSNTSFTVQCVYNPKDKNYLYKTVTFWSFVLLMAIGSIGYNVANSISDAICFDVLGEGGEMEYGKQRVFGAIGFGLSALLAGYVIDLFSTDETMKNYAPAFLLTLAFGLLDIFTCSQLKLPKLPKSDSIVSDVASLLKHRHIVIFLIFATFAGICDSFIIYFMFWYLEDLAALSGAVSHVKLIEGLVIAAETLGGEMIFFSYAGKIIERIGYEHCLSLSFAFYALRLGLISLANNPWWILPTEFFLQGPSFALCYTTIVAYASAVAPPGTSATMQGLVAGMDDGFGYAVGSFAGGILYRSFGGSLSFLMYGGLALICAISHSILHVFFLRVPSKPTADTCSTDYHVVPQVATGSPVKDCSVQEEKN